MKKQAIFRSVMLVAGFFAVTIILFSHAFSPGKEQLNEKSKTEKKEESKEAVVQAPTEAIPGSAVQLKEGTLDQVTGFIGLTETEESSVDFPAVIIKRYLKVLFRTIISPNAP